MLNRMVTFIFVHSAVFESKSSGSRDLKWLEASASLKGCLPYVVVAASGDFLFGGAGGSGLPCGFWSEKLNLVFS